MSHARARMMVECESTRVPGRDTRPLIAELAAPVLAVRGIIV
jgi:hypothetical protein